MSTSGTTDWNPALLYILKQALLNATAIQEGEDPSAELYQEALLVANGLIKSLEATGLHVWTEEEGVVFLDPGQAKYVFGVGAGLPAAAPISHSSDAETWAEYTLAQPSVAGSHTITLTTAAGISSGQNIGVVDNDGLTEWTTVNGAPAGAVVTLTDALLVNVDAGNFALVYSTPIGRPLKIPLARLLTLNGLLETPMTILSRQEYQALPDKTSPGTPTQWFYSPRRDQGFLYVWPVSVDSSYAVRFTWYRSIQDFLLPTNTADVPQEWVLPLIWNISQELAPGYGVPEPTWVRIQSMAEKYALLVISYDRESEPVQFGMDTWAYDTSNV